MTEHTATTTGRGGRAAVVRTWQPEPPTAPPPAQVADPAVRAVLRTVSRALKMISAEIDRRVTSGQAED